MKNYSFDNIKINLINIFDHVSIILTAIIVISRSEQIRDRYIAQFRFLLFSNLIEYKQN